MFYETASAHSFKQKLTFAVLRIHGCQMVYFRTKKSRFLNILKDFGMEHLGLFHDHSVYFVVIWYMLWAFGMFSVRLV
jgi:hypothetical protein